MFFDYETYKVIWWCLVGALLVGFALTDGFDFGIGIFLPLLGRNDEERGAILHSIAPTWEGKHIWLIASGACLFAAWPLLYRPALSGFSLALMLCLSALLFRPLGFRLRHQLGARQRRAWDCGLFAGGLLPPLVFGITFGNLLQGVPFTFDDSMRLQYSGSFASLLNPFGLLAGLLSVSMLALHGATWLQQQSGGALRARARKAVILAAVATTVLFAAAGVWIALGIEGYRIDTMPDVGSRFMPITKMVGRASGAWLDNYTRWPLTLALPIAAFAGALLSIHFSVRDQARAAFVASGVTVAAIILTAGAAMFPFVLPSSLAPGSSLTAWDAVASHASLATMFWTVVATMPVIICYTSWVQRLVRRSR